jgi:hypothetical protein
VFNIFGSNTGNSSANVIGTRHRPSNLDKMALMFRAIVFFSLTMAALGSEKLDVLVNAAASFSATIQQQLETLQSDPSPAELAEKTIDYAEAKTAYFNALRAEHSRIDENRDLQGGAAT